MSVPSETIKWTAIVLAGGRGPDDPLAKAFSVSHKCQLPVGGVAMLKRVTDVLQAHPLIGRVIVSIDNLDVAQQVLGAGAGVDVMLAEASAAQSAGAAVRQCEGGFPVLITTADHALLDADMLDYFLAGALAAPGDLAVGLASAETILGEYPNAKRTFLAFGRDRVSGCNLYALKTLEAVKAVDFWQKVEQDRKNPIALVKAFGCVALLRYLSGWLTLETAFELASERLGLTAKAVLMPFANAAVDIDKPEDKQLVEQILARK